MKKFFVMMFSLFFAAEIFAVDLTFHIDPGVVIPLKENFVPGFVGYAQASVDLFGFLNVGVEGTYGIEVPSNMTTPLTTYGGGLGVGAYYYPLSRLHLGLGGSIGVYNASMKISGKENSFSDLYWRGYGEIGYRINPSLTVSGFGGYTSYLVTKNQPMMSGPIAGISVSYTVSLGKGGSSGFRISKNQDDPIFPIFMGAYNQNAMATISIHNQEGAEINDVHVSFRAGKYTSQTLECAHFSRIKKYGTVEVPLRASFSNEILKFSENGKISGEIVIEYKFLGKTKQTVQNISLDIYNRNSFMWYDSSALAAFISPDVEEVSQFAKYVAGIARGGFRTGLSRNLEIAIAMYESLKLAKVSYSDDKTTPYLEYHFSDQLDSIQYPLQTMNHLGGDYDDLGLLLASCLESVGVPTGYLICDDDFIVLVDLEVKPTSAGNHFADVSKLVVDDQTAYFGISMKKFDSNFAASLAAAGEIIKQANNGDIYCEYVNTHEAWETYIPVAFTGLNGLFSNPGQTKIESAYNTSLNSYVNKEINGVIANARASGDPNKIGLAYVRIGRYSEAKAEFSKSNSIPAMNNLANVYILEKNYTAAINQFRKVLQIEPENQTALKGIEKATAQMGM